MTLMRAALAGVEQPCDRARSMGAARFETWTVETNCWDIVRRAGRRGGEGRFGSASPLTGNENGLLRGQNRFDVRAIVHAVKAVFPVLQAGDPADYGLQIDLS